MELVIVMVCGSYHYDVVPIVIVVLRNAFQPVNTFCTPRVNFTLTNESTSAKTTKASTELSKTRNPCCRHPWAAKGSAAPVVTMATNRRSSAEEMT